tara:strand:+ start:17595 stop:18479 length:885 start_codon:yes stop_codon:yes gene_type:complete
MSETPVVFDCEGDKLVGILHQPEDVASIGVVIIVAGGPQFRVGAHRQFVILGRELTQQGCAVLRFDHRGTGDSAGSFRGFLDMQQDIKTAIDTLIEANPQLEKIALWGECESASAAAFYAYSDSRVAGIYMVNPWIRTESGQAKTYLKHYYWNRIRDPRFWHKVRSGQFSPLRAMRSWFKLLREASTNSTNTMTGASAPDLSNLTLPERLTRSLALFDGRVFILTSGNDYIAQEFNDFKKTASVWKESNLNDTVEFSEMTDADHTFSRAEWRDELFRSTGSWLQSLDHQKGSPE